MFLQRFWFGAVAILALLSSALPAGDLDPPGAPQQTMLTLSDLASAAQGGRVAILPDATASPGLLIDQPGSYVLLGDVTMLDANATCIEIAADDVHIDLNGHTIAGQSSESARGVHQTSGSRASVVNGTVRNFGVFPIDLRAVATVRDVRVSFNARGGVRLQSASICLRVIANANDSLLAGDAMIGVGRDSLVKDCVVTGTVGPGVGIQTGFSSQVIGCSLGNHDGDGIHVSQASVVRDCTVENVGGDAYIVEEASRISGCTAQGGQMNGIVAQSGSAVTDNVLSIFQNGRGISVEGDRCRVTDNLLENCGEGIIVDGGMANQIVGNTVINDGNEVGLGTVSSSTRNLFVRNMISGVVIGVEMGNTVGPLVVGTNVLTSDLPWANLEH